MARHWPISIQAPTWTAATNGERTAVWNTVATANATIKPLSGRELERAKSYSQTVSHVLDDVRYNPAIVATCRIQFGSRYFSIDAALNVDEASHMMKLYATETKGG